ncbi:phosphatase PAP2 family protein [Streptomyces albus]
MTGTAVSWLLTAGLPLLLLGVSLSLPRHWWPWPPLRVLLRESGIILAVFLVWQIPARTTGGDLAAAVHRARWIHHWEQRLGLPDEAAWQRLALPHSWLVQAANGYYALMHFGAMAALLAWLAWRHRAAYPRVRTDIVLVTVVSLLLQTFAVAPPRLVAGLGFTDTAERYGQSVYSAGAGSVVADELSAVPSVHISWALLVALAVVRVSRSRARGLVVAHPLLTLLVVIVTANHFWLDALVAVAVVALCTSAHRVVRARRLPAPARGTPVQEAPAAQGDDG